MFTEQGLHGFAVGLLAYAVVTVVGSLYFGPTDGSWITTWVGVSSVSTFVAIWVGCWIADRE